jgi:hypothetical protein
MPWKWSPPWTPKRSAPHDPNHRRPASTTLTVVIVMVVILVLAALARWYMS